MLVLDGGKHSNVELWLAFEHENFGGYFDGLGAGSNNKYFFI